MSGVEHCYARAFTSLSRRCPIPVVVGLQRTRTFRNNDFSEKLGRCILLNAMIGSRALSNDCKPGLSNRGRTRFLRRHGCGVDR